MPTAPATELEAEHKNSIKSKFKLKNLKRSRGKKKKSFSNLKRKRKFGCQKDSVENSHHPQMNDTRTVFLLSNKNQ